jgi:cytochrome c-type biogenesis protein
VDSYLAAVGSAVWLGILTSISPCPLASNIAAISFVGRRVDRPAKVLAAGLLYTLGRMVTYVAVGALAVASILSIPQLSFFLQNNINKILGPILLVVGLILLGLSGFNLPGMSPGAGIQKRAERWGLWGAAPLGLLFALSFCPISAALFFGSLIPLATKHQSSILMPTVYGIGTALPVVGFALLLALGTRWVGVAFNKLSAFERWARRVTGAIFIVVGIYFILSYLLGIPL